MLPTIAMASSGYDSSASLRRVSSGPISPDVLGCAESRRRACVSFWLLKGSKAAPSVYACGVNFLGSVSGVTVGRTLARSSAIHC